MFQNMVGLTRSILPSILQSIRDIDFLCDELIDFPIRRWIFQKSRLYIIKDYGGPNFICFLVIIHSVEKCLTLTLSIVDICNVIASYI
jgi:hypothetical protein